MTPLLPRMLAMHSRVLAAGLPAICWYIGEDEYERLTEERPDLFPKRTFYQQIATMFMDLAIICLPELSGVEIGIECLD